MSKSQQDEKQGDLLEGGEKDEEEGKGPKSPKNRKEAPGAIPEARRREGPKERQAKADSDDKTERLKKLQNYKATTSGLCIRMGGASLRIIHRVLS